MSARATDPKPPADLAFAATASAAVRGADHLLILGRAQVLRTKRPWAKLLRGRWTSALDAMVKQTSPGDLGRTVSTWPSAPGAPQRVSVGVMPDAVSRHVSPSRAHAVESCCRKAELDRSRRVGVLLVLEEPAHYLAAANAVGRALPLYDRRTKSERRLQVVIAAVDERGVAIAPPDGVSETVACARWAAAMVDRPTAELDTAMFVDEARRFLHGVRGVKATTIVGDDLLRHGLGGIHAVGRAAVVPPRLLVLEHAPRGAQLSVALVGKGVVFDTGGLALKPREAMLGMKGDMGGAAAVVGAFRTLVSGGTSHRIIAFAPLAENAIGPNSYRQDEILQLHSGKTVEINNTDAEGRLLLADAVSLAVRAHEADVVVDAATLTGAQLIATGRRHAAVVSNRQGLESLAVRAGLRSGDLCHPLPFAPEFYRREFKSEVADMKNSVKDRVNAQASCAAQFVWSHVEDTGVPWLHVDLAGPAHVEDRGTGFGVALLAEIVNALATDDLAA